MCGMGVGVGRGADADGGLRWVGQSAIVVCTIRGRAVACRSTCDNHLCPDGDGRGGWLWVAAMGALESSHIC
jgi:hypothetical protein